MTSPTPGTTPGPTLAAAAGAIPEAAAEGRWHYWVAFVADGGKSGACEMSRPQRITRREHIEDLQATLARHLRRGTVVVVSFTLLRIEDATGQVIG